MSILLDTLELDLNSCPFDSFTSVSTVFASDIVDVPERSDWNMTPRQTLQVAPVSGFRPESEFVE